MVDTASLRDFLPSHMLLSWALFGLFFFEAVLFLSRKLSQPLLVFFFAKRCYGNGDHTSPHCSRDTSPCDESSTAADTDDEEDKAKQTQVQSANPGPIAATSTTTGKKNKNKSCHAGKDGEKQQFPTTTSPSPTHKNRADSRSKNIFYTALSKKKQNDWDMYVVSFSYAVVMAAFGCYAIMYPAMRFPTQQHARYDGLLLSDTDRSVFPLNLSRWFFSTFFPAVGGTSKNQAPVFNNDEASHSLYLLRRDGYSEIAAVLVSFTAGLFLSGTIRELLYGTPAFTLHHFIVLLNCCIALNGPYFLYWTVYLYTWEISNIGLNSMGLCEIMPEFSRGKVHAALRGLFFVLFLSVRVVFGTPLSYYCLRDLFGEAMRLGVPSGGVAGSYTAWTIAITSSIAFGLNAMWAVIILRKGLKEIKRLMGVYFSGDKQLGPGGMREMMPESRGIKEE